MKSIFPSLLAISFFSLLVSCIPSTSIDVESCKKKADPCEQYHCLFPGCWCVPDTTGRMVLFEAGKSINNLDEAKKLANEFLEKNGIKIERLDLLNDDYGWFHMVFDTLDGDKEIHYSISPKGEICHTECGV